MFKKYKEKQMYLLSFASPYSCQRIRLGENQRQSSAGDKGVLAVQLGLRNHLRRRQTNVPLPCQHCNDDNNLSQFIV